MSTEHSLAKFLHTETHPSLVHFVTSVGDLKGLVSVTFIGPAKDVTNTSLLTFVRYHPYPYATTYARTVMYRLPLDGVESFSTKCPNEKEMRDHEYVKITPVNEELPDSPVEQMEDMARTTKRLVLCTSCGTLRLIN